MSKQKDQGSGVSELRGSQGINWKGKERMSKSELKGQEENRRSWNDVVIVIDGVVQGATWEGGRD